jgi:hypothetical protein
LRQNPTQVGLLNKIKRINSPCETQTVKCSRHPQKWQIPAFPIEHTQTPRLPPSHVSQRGPTAAPNGKDTLRPASKNLKLSLRLRQFPVSERFTFAR